jgi:hypothetical protein
MQFVAPQAGAPEINLAVNATGVVRSYKGYWVGRYPPPSLPTSQARLAKRPMTAVYSAASDASAGGYSQAIDVSTLTPGATDKIGLPYGAVGNNYAVSLNLTGCADTDMFSWTVTDDAGGRVKITQSGGVNQTVLFTLANLGDSDISQPVQVTVQLTNTSASPAVIYTMLFDIAVIKCDTISFEPTVLPPVVVGAAYRQQLTAYGARGNFTWSVIASSLPPGLTWDANSHQLFGTVTDATQVGKVFSLALELTASDVIMDPLPASLPITVQSGAAVASGIPSWANILINVGPGTLALTVIAALALRSFLVLRADAKNAEVIRVANTNLENATNGNPKLVSQNISRLENRTNLTVEEMNQNNERIIEGVAENFEAYYRQLGKITADLVKLTEYVERNPDGAPNDPVTDKDIEALHYTTYGEVERGISMLTVEQNYWKAEIIATGGKLNAVRITQASGQSRLDDASSSESNNERLLDEQ